MANAAVVYRNLADAATVTGSTQVPLMPATNVQQEHISRKWRSISADDYLLIDFGESTSIDTVWIGGLTTTKVQLRASNSDATGETGEIYDSTLVAADQNHLQKTWVLGSAVSARYWRIDLEHDDLDYVEAGRVVMGVRSVYQYNYAFGFEVGYSDPSIRTQSAGGQTHVTPKRSYRHASPTFEWVSKADRDGFVEAIDRDNGLKTDVLFLLDPESAHLERDTIWGLMSELTAISQPFFDIWSKQYRIEERR